MFDFQKLKLVRNEFYFERIPSGGATRHERWTVQWLRKRLILPKRVRVVLNTIEVGLLDNTDDDWEPSEAVARQIVSMVCRNADPVELPWHRFHGWPKGLISDEERERKTGTAADSREALCAAGSSG